MNCPHCATDDTQTLNTATDLGCSRFRCRQCRRRFNERTGTPFNRLEFPTDIVFQVVVFRLLFKLSLRDLVRMFLIRGYEFSYETVRDWEERFAPLLAEQLRGRRKGKIGRRWYVDETYLKVKGIISIGNRRPKLWSVFSRREERLNGCCRQCGLNRIRKSVQAF